MKKKEFYKWMRGREVRAIITSDDSLELTNPEKRRPVLWTCLGILVLIYFATMKIERDTYRRGLWDQKISESMEKSIQIRVLKGQTETLKDLALDKLLDFQEIDKLLKMKNILWPGNGDYPDSHLTEEEL